MTRAVAMVAALVLTLVPLGLALAEDGKSCRTGRETYSPARSPLVAEWLIGGWSAVQDGDIGGGLRQVGLGLRLFAFRLEDLAAVAGYCVAPDADRAADFFAGEAEGESAASLLQLAVLTANGEGVAADPVRAVALFRRGLLRAFTRGTRDWNDALHAMALPSLPPVLAAQRGWADDAIRLPHPQALAFVREFLDPGNPAWDPMAACLYLDEQSWKAPEVAFALYRMMRDQPGRLPAPPEAAEVWLDHAATGRYGPALAEAGRRFMAMDAAIAKMDAITYLVAAQKAGEDVGDLLRQAMRDQPSIVIEAALRNLDAKTTIWWPSISLGPEIRVRPCSHHPAKP